MSNNSNNNNNSNKNNNSKNDNNNNNADNFIQLLRYCQALSAAAGGWLFECPRCDNKKRNQVN